METPNEVIASEGEISANGPAAVVPAANAPASDSLAANTLSADAPVTNAQAADIPAVDGSVANAQADAIPIATQQSESQSGEDHVYARPPPAEEFVVPDNLPHLGEIMRTRISTMAYIPKGARNSYSVLRNNRMPFPVGLYFCSRQNASLQLFPALVVGITRTLRRKFANALTSGNLVKSVGFGWKRLRHQNQQNLDGGV